MQWAHGVTAFLSSLGQDLPLRFFFVFWLLMIRHGLDRVPRTVCLSCFSVRSLRDNTILGVFLLVRAPLDVSRFITQG